MDVRTQQPRAVVVTALNLVTSLGLDFRSTWKAILAGQSGVQRISRFDTAGLATQIAAELPGEFEEFVGRYCSRRLRKMSGRAVTMGIACAKAAIEEHGIDFAAYPSLRRAVIFGAADTGHAAADSDDFWILKTMMHAVPACLAIDYGCEGPCYVTSAACASSAYAIAAGYDLIASGRADIVIAGGSSSISNREHIRGFNELGALSTKNDDPARASRPFSADRDGFVIGEGAGVLVLEAAEAAAARGALVYGEIAGYGMTNEAYNLMSPRPEGEGMARTMQVALASSGVLPTDVDYINAHGTATVQNDAYETEAIRRLFGARAAKVPVSSTKSMLGHTAGACGAVEAAVTLLAMHHGVLPPTINHTADPQLNLDFVPNVPRACTVRAALSNSFGFGGCNATLVFRQAYTRSM